MNNWRNPCCFTHTCTMSPKTDWPQQNHWHLRTRQLYCEPTLFWYSKVASGLADCRVRSYSDMYWGASNMWCKSFVNYPPFQGIILQIKIQFWLIQCPSNTDDFIHTALLLWNFTRLLNQLALACIAVKNKEISWHTCQPHWGSDCFSYLKLRLKIALQ